MIIRVKDKPTQVSIETLAGLLTGKTPLDDLANLSDKDLLDALDYHGITLLAAEQNTLPSSLEPRLKQRRAMAIANEAIKQTALTELFNAFAEAGLESIMFKGSALAYSIYQKPSLRPRSDTDILVSAKDKANFDRVFAQQGFNKLFAIEGSFVSHQSTYGKHLLGETYLNIDLHWQINNRQMFAQTFSATSLGKTCEKIERLGEARLSRPIETPSIVNSLLIAAIHRAGHHNKEDRLAWFYDIHLLANCLNDSQWRALSESAIEKKVASITADALLTSQRYFDSKLNAQAIDRLRSAKDEPSRIFLQTNLSERHYFWADLQSLKSMPEKLKFLQETLVPSPSYIRKQMGTRSALLGYAKRFIRGIKRVF